MGAKIVPVETRPMASNKECVQLLESVLEAAREGKVTSIAFAWTQPCGSTSSAYSRTDTFQTLLGAMDILKFRMLSEL